MGGVTDRASDLYSCIWQAGMLHRSRVHWKRIDMYRRINTTPMGHLSDAPNTTGNPGTTKSNAMPMERIEVINNRRRRFRIRLTLGDSEIVTLSSNPPSDNS